MGSFRLDHEYEVEYEYDFSILVLRLRFKYSQYIPKSTHEPLSLPKINMKKEGSGNVTGLKFESRTRTQSRTRSPI